MSEIICIVEHQSIPIVDKRRSGEVALTRDHAQKLAMLKTVPQHAFNWGHNSIKWSQFCGLVQFSDLTLEILPKVFGKEEDVGSSRTALIRMLKKAGLVKLHKPGGAAINLQKHTLLDVFIQDFCDQLNKQLIQGKLRQYITEEENLPVLRGKLLSNMQLRHNLAHKERLFCQYDELSEDIPINRVIKYTLRLMLPKARSQRVKKALSQLLYPFDAISDTYINVDTINRITLNRSESRYQSILDICLIFIQGLSPDTSAGKQQEFSLLFDMNQLFESWIAAQLRPVATTSGFRLLEQKPRKYMAYRQDLEREVFQMKPDISFVRDKKAIVIADAKWKLLEHNEAKLGVSQSDLYQMQAYANRYGVDSLILIYPKQANLQGSYSLNFQGANPVKLMILTIAVDGGVDSAALESVTKILANVLC